MKTENYLEETCFDVEKEFVVRPLDRTGLNKHYLNMINADVFKPGKKLFLQSMFNLFSSVK